VKIGAFSYRFKIPMKELRGGKVVMRKALVQQTTVFLDGKKIGTRKRPPFSVAIDGSKLTVGKHKLVMKAVLKRPFRAKLYKRTYTKTFNACM
jgi:hypothetical protein